MEIDYTQIGIRLSARRRKLKLTQEMLSNITNISANQLSNIENNHSVPTIETIIKFCDALDVTPDYFLLGIVKDAGSDSIKAISQKAMLCTEKQQRLIGEFISLLIQENY